MKYLTAFILFTVTVCHGLRLPSKWAKEVALGDSQCPGVFSCKDCNTVRVCHPKENSGELVVLKEIECPADRPWCDAGSGTCVEKEPASCGKEDNFICLKNNQYFPDENCHRFHFCDEKYEPKLFECHPNTKVFNPIKQQCDDPSLTPCKSFNCKNQAVKKATHDHFTDYYAMCNNDEANTSPLVVNVCPNMYILNITSQVCEPDCKKYVSMNIPDNDDCHYYFHCDKIIFTEGQELTKIVRHQCPEGQAYDRNLYTCENEGTVDACTKKQ